MDKLNMENLSDGWKQILDNILALNNKELFISITNELKKDNKEDLNITRIHHSTIAKTDVMNGAIVIKNNDETISFIPTMPTDPVQLVRVHDIDLPMGTIIPADGRTTYIEFTPEEQVFYNGYIKGFFDCRIQADNTVKTVQNQIQEVVQNLINGAREEKLQAYEDTIKAFSNTRADAANAMLFTIIKGQD